MGYKPTHILSNTFFFIFVFTPVFAITASLAIPLIISFIYFFCTILLKTYDHKPVNVNKFLLYLSLGGIFFILLSFFVNISLGYGVNIRHFIGITIMYVFYLIVPLIMVSEITANKAISIVSYSFIFVVFFGLLDFFLYNFLGVSLGHTLLRFPPESPTGYGHFGGLFRSKSVFQEPGFYAWYLNTIGLFLIGFFYCTQKVKLAKLFTALYFISLLTTFSATGFLVLICLFFLLSLTFIRKPIHFIFLLSTILIGGYLAYDFLSPVIEAKVFGESVSKIERMQRWSDGIHLFKNNIWFGGGLGSYSLIEDTGLASFLLKILAEAGIISFISFISLWFYTFINIYKSHAKSVARVFLYTSLFGAFLHWATSTPFYFAFSWVYFVLINSFIKSMSKYK
jgi:hypothetical protein